MKIWYKMTQNFLISLLTRKWEREIEKREGKKGDKESKMPKGGTEIYMEHQHKKT